MRNQGLTLVEVLFVVAVLAVLAGMVPINCTHATEAARKANCKENLSQIGKAIVAYNVNYNEFFPFAWGPANGACSPMPGSNDSCDAATSLGCLYPQYVNTPKVFRCPSTEDQPSFVVNTPAGVISPAAQGRLWENRNFTLKGNQPGRASSYGYDPRIYPGAASNTAILADWDGSYFVNHDTSTQNHDAGQNVLYVDGNVRWQGGNYVSSDGLDNIFAEDPWNADTDSFLVNGSVALTRSYEEYKALQR